MQELDWFGNHHSFVSGSSAALHWRKCWGYHTVKSVPAAASRVFQSSASLAAVSSSVGITASSISSQHLGIQLPAESDRKSDLSESDLSSSVRVQEGCFVPLSRSQCSLCVSLSLHTIHYCSECEQVASSYYADAYSSAGYLSRQSWVQDDSGWWSWSYDRGRWG